MCGILFILSFNHHRTEVIEKSLLPLLQNRGPDGQHTYNVKINTSHDIADLQFHGTVLQLRGELTNQPLVNENGHVFLWNGEIFGGGVKVPENANDTFILYEALQKLPFNDDEHHCQLISLFADIQGPWAFVFYDAVNMNLWYGRDYFGRRSLMSCIKEDTFCLSSLGHRMFTDEFTEVPAKVLYCLNVKELDKDHINDYIKTYPIQPFYNNTNITCTHMVQHRCIRNSKQMVLNNCNSVLENTSDECQILNTNNMCTCNKQKQKQGLNDIEINQEKTDLCVNNVVNDELNHVQPILDEKKCIQKGNVESTNRVCCRCLIYNTDMSLNPNGVVSICKTANCKNCEEKTAEELLQHICSDCNLLISLSNDIMTFQIIRAQFLTVLEDAVRLRVNNLPRGQQLECSQQGYNGSKVGILFSGGIDSVILTSLADRCTPVDESIDLINVAFAQRPKVQQSVKKKHQKPNDDVETLNFDVPDRITGRTALKELPKKRQWNFVEVDVTLEELQKTRKSRITNLVYPLDSVLDDSIGCAIWFAARGVGRCYVLSSDGEMQLAEEIYTSPVKVLLTGMGADEQLGGYARHRTKFESAGWVGLENEMKMEVERISARNLGRDDRCISDHGREARFPFLDENVVSFLQHIPVCVKCDPRLPRGEGEKILLREVALSLGLPYSSKLPKRAIQFGSRIAKLESSKEKGSDNCKRLKDIKLS